MNQSFLNFADRLGTRLAEDLDIELLAQPQQRGPETRRSLLDNLRREGRLREIRRGGDVYLAPIEGRYADSP